MGETYYDPIIDCTLMIGVNEFSGLNRTKLDKSDTASEFEIDYQQHILAVISASIAMFPLSNNSFKYPPEEFQSNDTSIIETPNKPIYSKQQSHDKLHIIQDLVIQYNKTDIYDKMNDRNSIFSLNRRHSRMQSKRKSIKAISIENYKGTLGSVSIDTIRAFPGTYFNNNLKINKTYEKPKIEILPMTDNLGNRSYGFRLEFFRMFNMESFAVDDDNKTKSKIKIEQIYETDIDSSTFIFVPCNIVFFSKYPYFDLFKDILSQLFQSINNRSTQFIEDKLMEYSSILTRIPIMKSGNIQLNFSIDNTIHFIKPNNPTFEQIIDWDMSLLFQILSLDNIILIIIAMFQERKIAFFSNYTNIITLVCESLIVLFQPFTWRHFYLPVVPCHLYELIDAIFPFMIGLPHNLKGNVINSYDDIYIVDLDEGSVSLPKTCTPVSFSKNWINQLKENLKQRQWLTCRENYSNISLNSIEQWKEFSYRVNKQYSDKIMHEFMVLMVNLFQEILGNSTTFEKKDETVFVANLDRYFATSHSENVEFFKSIHQSDNFSCFLSSKLRKLTPDSWTRYCDKIYPDFLYYLHLQNTKTDIRKCKTTSTKSERNENIKLSVEEPCQVIYLPTSKNERQGYFANVLKRIDNLIPLPNVLMLKIEILLQMRNHVEALKLIDEILSTGKESLEYSKIKQIIRGIDKNLRKQCDNMPFSQLLKDILKNDNDFEPIPGNDGHITQFNPPNVSIPKNFFYDICKEANITDFENTVDDLFKCLTLDQKLSKKHLKCLIPPDLFQCFYKNWILMSTYFNAEEADFNPILEEISIITTDSYVKVDGFGQGRILLTHLRLLFIPFGKTTLKPIIDFSNEIVTKIKVDKRIRGFGKLSEVLEITKSNSSKKILIWFSHDIEIWCNLIREIKIGNRMSKDEKDASIIERVTEQCLVYETLSKCSKENPYFKKYLYDFSKILLNMSIHETEGNRNIQNGTHGHRKYLITKLMPFPKQAITIDDVIAVHNPVLNNFDLWCAVIIGEKIFVKIFQIINENFQQLNPNDIPIKSRVKFMMYLTDTNTVLLGCNNGTVCLVSCTNFTTEESNICDNPGIFPTCGVVVKDNNTSTIYLGINNGEVIKSDDHFKSTKKVVDIKNSANINFMEVYDTNTLIIGTGHEIFNVTTNGHILSTIKITEITTILNRISYMKFRNQNKIIVGLARLPVLIEYDIQDITKPVCLRQKNLLTNKDFVEDNLSGNSENTSKQVGISSILNVTHEYNQNHFWIIYKDGTIEIRNCRSLNKINSFNGHIGTMSGSIVCEISKRNIIITFGKDDGKVILWNVFSS